MKRGLAFMFTLLLCVTVCARELDTLNIPSHRPRVGVVLSGGGAKGVAHIGVLKVIEEAGIPVDYVVGTSIGSIIGGLYSLGYDAMELDSLVREQNWAYLMSDEVTRRQISFQEKMIGQKCILAIPFMDNESFEEEARRRRDGAKKEKKGILSNLPSAFVEGQNLESLFTKLSVGYQDDIDFNTLPIPFACVAVDLNTKEEVVFHSGDIVEAIRSSMSIPGYFAPMKKGNMYLVDGGMLNNFPVDVARQMGADIVIGIDLHEFDKGRTQPVDNIGDMVTSMLNIMNGEKYHSGRADADIIIAPNTGDFGILAFDPESVRALVDSGYVAAKKVMPVLEALSRIERLSGEKEAGSMFAPTRNEFRPPKAINIERDSIRLGQVTITGASPREMKWLLSKTDFTVGKMIDGKDIDNSIRYLYDSRAFSKVKYSIAGKDSLYNLKIKFNRANNHVFGLGFRFDTYEMASLYFHLGYNQSRLFGFKADFDTKLGTSPYFGLDAGYTFCNRLGIWLTYRFDAVKIDSYYRDKSLSYSDREQIHTTELALRLPSSNCSRLQVGAKLDGHIARNIQEMTGDEIRGNHFAPFISYQLDNLDDPYFPTKGVKMDVFSADYCLHFGIKDESTLMRTDFIDLRFNFAGVIPCGNKVTIVPQVYTRYLDRPVAVLPRFYGNLVGGYVPSRFYRQQMPFVGVNRPFWTESSTAIARLDVNVNVSGCHYIKGMANLIHYGSTIMDFLSEWSSDNVHSGVALGYYYKSFIGPIGLNFQWSDYYGKTKEVESYSLKFAGGQFGIYFSIGYDF